MQFNCLLFLSVASAAQCAVIPSSDIPVKVIYEKEESHRVYIRNLDKTEQDDVKQEIAAENIVKPEEIKDEDSSEVCTNALESNDEKLPLSLEELPGSLRYLPKEPEDITNDSEDTPKEPEDTPKEPEENNSKKIVVPDEISEGPVQPQQPSQDDDFFDKVQEIVNNGVSRIKEDIEQSQEVVEPEVWTSFNDGVSDFLKKVKDRNSLRQGSNAIILEQFSSFTSNFFSGVTGQNKKPQDSVQNPTFPQKVFQAFQNGVGQMQASFTAELSAQVKSSSTPPPGPIQGFVQKAQQAFANFVNPSQKPGDGNSSTPLQNIQNSISNALGNVFNRPSGAAGDESSTQVGPFQAIQAAIQNLNPFRSTTAKPPDSSSSNPIPTNPVADDNPIQSDVQYVIGGYNSAIPGNDPVQ